MGYGIDITDMNDDGHVVSLEHAERSSIRLKWHGDDSKDEKNIMGSSLFLTLEGHISNNKDGMFAHLFTADETQYMVRFYEEESDVTIWSGFLLPESYGEPYTADTFYVVLEATDGLARLKGKYLEDDFYTENETGTVDIIAKCLQLTGLELPIFISPAIKNVNRDRYDDIFLPGEIFTTKTGNLNAYKVLEKVVHDMLCRVVQVENAWFVEGFNQLSRTKVTYDRYTYLGVFQEREEKQRLIKTFRPIGTPQVDIVPPYKSVTVSQERVQQGLPEAIGNETNDGWAIGQGVNGDIFPTHWFGNGGYYPKALSPDYKVTLPVNASDAFNVSKYISLLRKVYVNRYDKMVFTMRLRSEVPGKQNDASFVDNGVRVTFRLNGNILYQVNKSFQDQELLFQFDLYASDSGLLDLEVTEPYFDGNLQDGTFPQYITIQEIELERIDFEENERFVDEVSSNYSIEKEYPLEIADDMTGFSKAFRLQPLNGKSNFYNAIQVNILYPRNFDGEHYVILDLFGANLVNDNLDSVYYGGSKLEGVKVHYNFLNGDEMAVRVPVEILAGSLEVRRYRIDDVVEERGYWEQWSDAVFPVESDRYGQAAAKVLRRMYLAPFERVDFSSESAYKINDIISFNYRLPNNFFFTSLEWNVDMGNSTGTMLKCVYEDQVTDVGTGNISPIVNAGPDIVIVEFPAAGLDIAAAAFDPDGFIASVSWEVISGGGISIVNGDTLTPTLNAAGPVIYPVSLRVTVTDDDGAQASDGLLIIEESSHVLSLNNTLNFLDYVQSSKKEVLQITPELPDNSAIKIKGVYRIHTIKSLFGDPVEMICSLEIRKNGVLVFSKILATNGEYIAENGDFEFNYIKGDLVEFQLQHVFQVPEFGFAGPNGDLTPELVDYELVYFEINNVTFQAGSGVVSGYPIERFVIDV
jgi:hypothetical protein